MEKYIANLIPRLKAYGRKLNKIEEFVDKVWILNDVNGYIVSYRFKRGGVLRKSVNGDIYDLKWTLEGNDAIAVTDPKTGRGEMFRHGFILDGLLVVQKEGSVGLPTIFYNESVVPNGDVSGYLLDIFVKKENLRKLDDERGYFYKSQYGYEHFSVGNSVYDNELNLVNKDVLRFKDRTIYIVDGKIDSIVYFKEFNSDKGEVRIISDSYSLLSNVINEGDKIEFGNNTYFTGKLKINGFRVSVDKGIIKKSINISNIFLWIALILIVLFIFSTIQFLSKKSSANDGVSPLLDTTSTAPAPFDTTASAADTLIIQLSDINKNLLADKISSYFKMINDRDWTKVNQLFSSPVHYFSEPSISPSDIVNRLESYWGGMSNQARVYNNGILDYSIDQNNYICKTEVIELVEKGVYSIPYVYVADLLFIINTSFQITSLQSNIKTSKPYFHGLFGLDESIAIEDYALRNSTSDWGSILTKIQEVATNTPSVFKEYEFSILDTYGEYCYVEYNNERYSLKDYLSRIKDGTRKFNGVLKVNPDGNGKIITVY